MAYKVLNISVCVAIACCVVALIFQFVAVAGAGWLVGEPQTLDGEVREEDGLFRGCRNNSCVEVQSTWSPYWWKACQAFSILGLFTITGSLVCGILHAVLEDTTTVFRFGIDLCAASVVLLFIDVVAFYNKSSELFEECHFGYGFILSIIACILSVISAVLFAVGNNYPLLFFLLSN